MFSFMKNHMFSFKMLLLILSLVIIVIESCYSEVKLTSNNDKYEITVIDSHGPDDRMDELDSIYFSVDSKNLEAIVNEDTVINKVGLDEGIIEYDIEYDKDYSNAVIKEIRY